MDHTFITAPSQVKLITDLVFDMTGVAFSGGELAIVAMTLLAMNLVYRSPLFGRI